MSEKIDKSLRYRARPRPEWVRKVNTVGHAFDAESVVPLDEASLIRCAMGNTGLSDFGDETWREPFRILLQDLEETAELNLLGRLCTRSDLLVYLEGRLRVIDHVKRHPEVEREEIRAPVFVVGLPRSGTTIMQEVLGADPGARTVHMWEARFPVPPPAPGDPTPDPRIARADALVGIQDEITPEWPTMHKMGGDLPVECCEFMYSCFASFAFSISFDIPNYTEHITSMGPGYSLAWHKKILQLLQSTWRPHHWLLKNPGHLPVLPELFECYPDAKLVLMLRDPLKTSASNVDLCGTLLYMRTDNPDAHLPYGEMIEGGSAIDVTQGVIDWVEDGTIPRDQIYPVSYLDFFADPGPQLDRLYRALDMPLSPEARQAMLDYIAHKPKGKYGAHDYDHGDESMIAEERERFRAFQNYFGVENEV